MRWNHRVVKRTVEGEIMYAIHEVHYNKDDEICAMTESAVSVTAESVGGLWTHLNVCFVLLKMKLQAAVLLTGILLLMLNVNGRIDEFVKTTPLL